MWQILIGSASLGLNQTGKVAIVALTGATVGGAAAYALGRHQGRKAEAKDVTGDVLATVGLKADEKSAEAARNFLRSLGERAKKFHGGEKNLKEVTFASALGLSAHEGGKDSKAKSSDPLTEVLPLLSAAMATAMDEKTGKK